MMFLQSLTEHQSHLLGGFIALCVLFLGLLGLLLYLDKRGINTGARQQPKKPERKEQRGNEKFMNGGKNRRRRIKKQ